MRAGDQRAQTGKRAAADAAAAEMTDCAALFRPNERRAGAETDNNGALLAGKGETACADRGEFLDFHGVDAVNIAVHIGCADARQDDAVKIGQLKMIGIEKVTQRAEERSDRVLCLDAQHIDNALIGTEPHDFRARAADVDSQDNAHSDPPFRSRVR